MVYHFQALDHIVPSSINRHDRDYACSEDIITIILITNKRLSTYDGPEGSVLTHRSNNCLSAPYSVSENKAERRTEPLMSIGLPIHVMSSLCMN